MKQILRGGYFIIFWGGGAVQFIAHPFIFLGGGYSPGSPPPGICAHGTSSRKRYFAYSRPMSFGSYLYARPISLWWRKRAITRSKNTGKNTCKNTRKNSCKEIFFIRLWQALNQKIFATQNFSWNVAKTLIYNIHTSLTQIFFSSNSVKSLSQFDDENFFARVFSRVFARVFSVFLHRVIAR